MKITIQVPSMGESIVEATIGTILKDSGSIVKKDEEILELETDKVNQILYAQQSGRVEWVVQKGDVVKIGQEIGSIDDAAEQEKKTPPKAAAEAGEKKAPLSSKNPPKTQEKPIAEAAASPEPKKPAPAESPKPPPLQKTAGPNRTEGRQTRQKMSAIRKLIARRLVDCMQQTAMLTTFNEVDMTAIMEMREQHKEAFMKKHQVRLGLLSFFVKSVVSAMKAFPVIHAYIDGDDIVYRNYFDIGIAVSTDRGLVVPVLRDCDLLSFAEVEKAIEDYAGKARSNGLKVSDLEGGCLTITNGGVFGSLLSTPILNPGQSAILGLHKIIKRPVVIDDKIVIRQMMYLALSYDHRIIDGKDAVSFLVHLKKELEDPSCMLLEI